MRWYSRSKYLRIKLINFLVYYYYIVTLSKNIVAGRKLVLLGIINGY